MDVVDEDVENEGGILPNTDGSSPLCVGMPEEG